MMDHYVTEVGFKTVAWQSELYLNSKVAPDTCNATGLWLGSEPESKTVPLIDSHGDDSTAERITHTVVTLWVSNIKQKQNKKQQMQSLNTFLQEVQIQSLLTLNGHLQ